jgi:hypothetical protein
VTTSPPAARAAAVLLIPLAAALLVGCTSTAKPAAHTAPHAAAVATKRPAPSVSPAASQPLPRPTPSSAPLSAAQRRQVGYALAYWKHYNSAVYGNDNPNGGDCANFVSQTLLQRGWKMNASWYNRGQDAMSPAWAYVPSMLDYFEANASRLGLREFGMNDRAQYAVGDVVMFWWKNPNGSYNAGPDHVQVIDKITYTNGRVTVEMASHNEDYEYRDLDHEITVEHPGAKFVVWHLTRDTN